MASDQEPLPLPTDADHTGRSFGREELEELRKVLESGTLNSTRGRAVRAFEAQFAELLGLPYCRAVTSGTAAVHTALAALDFEPGDEIITSPITDMGAITPILYQAGIPVFADVDPDTCLLTAGTLARVIGPRTRGVIVTHLFGAPCDMDPILELCGERSLPVIEDAAQAYLARYGDRRAGTLGAIGCFSMQQGKHLSTGEGGMVVTRDPELFRRMRLFVDKAWGYGDPEPDHSFLALNYRMTELQGAVALAQLGKLEAMVDHRVRMARLLGSKLREVPGILPPLEPPGSRHVFWRYALRVDPEVIPGGPEALGRRLREAGIPCAPRYIRKPAFECGVLKERRTFGTSQFPFLGGHREGEPPIVYHAKDTPGAIRALARILVLPWNERYGEAEVGFLARALRKAAEACRA